MTTRRTRAALISLLLVAPVALAGCDGWLLGADPDPTPAAVFQSLWEEMDRYYAHFVVKDVDWAATGREFGPLAAAAGTEPELFTVLCSMLERLQDGHVNLYAFGDLGSCGYSGWYDRYPRNFEPGLIRDAYLGHDAAVTGDGRLTYGPLAPGIGYVHVADFGGEGWIDDVDQVLADLAPLHALIIDVRDNGGGSSRKSDALAARITDRPRLNSYVRFRNGPAHHDFTPPAPRIVEPAGPSRFTGPVAVLTNRRCFSACEGFVLAARVLPHVTIVGDTTGGGLGNPLFRELPNGWSFRAPVWLQTDPDDRPLEGVGIFPHLPVQLEVGDVVRGRDTILDAALAELRKDPTVPSPAPD